MTAARRFEGSGVSFCGVAVVALVLGLAFTTGCSNCSGSTGDDGTSPKVQQLPKLVLKDDSSGVLLTWIDKGGDFHVVQHPKDVPEDARDAVRVVTVDGKGAGSMLYVADLRKKNTDGSYVVRSVPRSQWEAIAEKRRKERMEALAPTASSSPATHHEKQASRQEPAATSLTAIVYGASWCSACRGAERYLRSQGVRVIFKDIDKDPRAQAEMRQKLARAGLRDRGSIPVIDLQGHVMIGFDRASLRRALNELTRGDYL